MQTTADYPAQAPMDGSQDDTLKYLLDLFEQAEKYHKDTYNLAKEDYEFVFGNQWPEKIKGSREKYGRVSLVENRMLPFVHQVVNSFRQTQPAIAVKPVGNGADKDRAELLQGIIRAIEYQSKAKSAYARGVFNAVAASHGWIRVRTEYLPETFEQRAVIESFLDYNCVYLDPYSKEIDGSDARYALVVEEMELNDFKKKYGYDPTAEAKVPDMSSNQWVSNDSVRVAEAYCKKTRKKTLYQTAQGVFYKETLPEGVEVLQQREEDETYIMAYVFTGGRVLEETEWVGKKHLPVVPVYGLEAFIEGRRVTRSMINPAKDPQRMYNYWKSCSTEVIALQPRAPFIAAEGQITEARVDEWRDAHKTNPAVLFYKPVVQDGVPVGKPEREMPPTGSVTMIQEANMASEAIKATLGIYDASLGIRSNEVSGIALQSRQQQTDNAVFHFWDNVRMSIAQVGRVLLDIIPVLYTPGRAIQLLGEKEETPQEQILVQDLTIGEYDVIATTGVEFATQRQEVLAVLMQLVQNQPAMANIIADLLVANMDIPDAEKIAARLRATIDPALLAEDPIAAKLQQSTALIQQLQAALDDKTKNVQFEQKIDAGELQLKAEEVRIKAMEAQARMMQMQQQQQAGKVSPEIAEAFMRQQEQLMEVGQALNLMLSFFEQQNNEPQTPTDVDNLEQGE